VKVSVGVGAGEKVAVGGRGVDVMVGKAFGSYRAWLVRYVGGRGVDVMVGKGVQLGLGLGMCGVTLGMGVGVSNIGISSSTIWSGQPPLRSNASHDPAKSVSVMPSAGSEADVPSKSRYNVVCPEATGRFPCQAPSPWPKVGGSASSFGLPESHTAWLPGLPGAAKALTRASVRGLVSGCHQWISKSASQTAAPPSLYTHSTAGRGQTARTAGFER